ncbi:leucine-rich repeat-containing protein 49-like isoform X2 [Acanthaster planci]|uniref:Leucine-rich repeat-containing protein 49-like isoform X2 n=1 Tax=Acanthaster planci TaxID=133434 RepID=A0A8B7ZTS6_ACAPL|nr:leucine-rich repeat-containing protein 49-like isoform X2 [Acanthaster planci]
MDPSVKNNKRPSRFPPVISVAFVSQSSLQVKDPVPTETTTSSATPAPPTSNKEGQSVLPAAPGHVPSPAGASTGHAHSSDFRFGRDQQNNPYRLLTEYAGAPAPGRRHSQPLGKDGEGHERHSSASYAGVPEHRNAPRHRQVHHPATAYATQLTDLSHLEGTSHHSKAQKEDPYNPYVQQTPRLVHSAGAVNTRQQKGTMHIPGDKVMIAESPNVPGVPVIFRSQEERSANPDRLNLDRRRLTMCPILEGEEHLRLLNFQHNNIRKIEHLTSMRRLIFLDLYDNQLEEITGLGALKSLRVLMLGKNRIKKIENLNALTKLDVLDLHGNQIERVENLSHLEELRVLNLAGNSITHVGNLAGMEALTELNLRRNKIITVSDVDNLPSLQRLFLSFNCITSYEDISCIANAQSLSEISLDGNPLAQDINYKSIILRNVHQIRQLDMKRVTEEERRISSTVAKREEEKKRETHKLVALKEKRRIAINNAARQWEASKSTAMAKTIRLQPGPYSMGREEGSLTPDNVHSRPGSGDMDTDRSQSVDLLDDKSRESSRASLHSESRKSSKAPTPDLLANISAEACHLAELDGDTLNLYGPGSMEALDKSWGVQAAGSVMAVSFKFIDFDKIAKHLHKIRIRFPNVATVLFGECNLSSLQQLNALTSLRRLDSISIASEGNPVTTFSLWRPYLLFRLSHLGIKKINNEEVYPSDHKHAEDLFSPISHITTSQLPPSRLLGLLGDHFRRNTQALTELELKAKKQLVADQKATSENIGRAGLQFFCEEALGGLLQERLSQSAFARSYVEELTSEAILMNQKQSALEKIWPQMFVEMVQGAVLRMWDLDQYRRTELRAFQKRK